MRLIEFEVLEKTWMSLERPPATGPKKYMFIRLPRSGIPTTAPMLFYNIQLVGYVPVIAQAEIINEVEENPKVLISHISKGVLIHIDSASLLGRKGKIHRKSAFKLCKKDLVHFVIPISTKADSNTSDSEMAMRHLERKFPSDRVAKWKRNATCLKDGIDFHT